jgi:hypothetical protein
MKILFLTGPDADYLEAQIFRGFCTLLGDQNVHDYPYKPTYHGVPTHTYTKGSVPHWPDHAGHTAHHPWFKPVDSPQLSTEQVIANIDAGLYKYVVFGSTRQALWASNSYLRAKVRKMPPGIMIDGEDHAQVHTTCASAVGSPVYFKRELHKAYSHDSIDVLPLPFSCGWADIMAPGDPTAPRSGAFLSCSMTHPDREKAMKLLVDDPRVILGVNSKHGSDYAAAMRSCVVGISVRGHGEDTLRQWEIPFHGALLLTDSHILLPAPLRAFYHSVDDLQGAVDIALNPQKVGLSIQAAIEGQRDLLVNHTPKARAEYILKEIESRRKP